MFIVLMYYFNEVNIDQSENKEAAIKEIRKKMDL